MIRLKSIKIDEELSDEKVLERVLQKNNLKKEEIMNWHIYKKSVDARKKPDIYYNYVFDVELIDKKKENKFEKVEYYKLENIQVKRKSCQRPVIIGDGPAGLFCAIILIENGIKPIIIERGRKVEDRTKDVNKFLETREFNNNSNVQFGEGGAGTFSDGKLNTGNSSIYSRKVLEEFVRFGAPEEILYVAKPHLGTDNLVNILKNMRNFIIQNGGEIRFEEKVIDFIIKDGRIESIISEKDKGTNKVDTDTVVLAIGHSAKDTFKKLYDLGVQISPKNFAVGVRIEHLQSDINYSQYGNKTKLKLGSADYKLVYHAKNGRTCYTFCMCPGGKVIASNSEDNSIVTNGMSNFARDGKNANSALLVNVNIQDFYKTTPLDGIDFQEKLEKAAFILGGNNYNAPIQRVEDFLQNKESSFVGKVKPTYKPGVKLSNLNNILPAFVSETIKEALLELNKKLYCFADKDAILTGIETRSSSPVQITRNKDSLNSVNVIGLYPCGEGAGYAGGIMTSAIDGIKCGLKILEN